MKIRRLVGIIGISLVAATSSMTLGCGGAGAKFAIAKNHDMPEGESWSGVYYNEVYGYLHLVESDGAVEGRWKRRAGSHWGELKGTVDGGVIRFDWTEHKIGALGPAAESHGKGWFSYSMGADNLAHADGQYMLDNSDDIGAWKNIKQKNIKPNLKSIKPESDADTPTSQDTWK